MYDIREDYVERPDNAQFDDTPFKDEWQDEVYARAAELAHEHELGTVLDIGTGSGYKLMKYLKAYHTVGVELEPALSFLKKEYPDREWMSPENLWMVSPFKLIICSDVIEHLTNPDELLRTIKEIGPKYIVLSTPDRSMLNCDQQGPPRNLHHVREWSFEEFGTYISRHFQVLEHYISNQEQCTQVIVCKPKY